MSRKAITIIALVAISIPWISTLRSSSEDPAALEPKIVVYKTEILFGTIEEQNESLIQFKSLDGEPRTLLPINAKVGALDPAIVPAIREALRKRLEAAQAQEDPEPAEPEKSPNSQAQEATAPSEAVMPVPEAIKGPKPGKMQFHVDNVNGRAMLGILFATKNLDKRLTKFSVTIKGHFVKRLLKTGSFEVKVPKSWRGPKVNHHDGELLVNIGRYQKGATVHFTALIGPGYSFSGTYQCQ